MLKVCQTTMGDVSTGEVCKLHYNMAVIHQPHRCSPVVPCPPCPWSVPGLTPTSLIGFHSSKQLQCVLGSLLGVITVLCCALVTAPKCAVVCCLHAQLA